MADVNFFDNFETQWAQSGSLESISEDQYKQGWAYIGATPPSVEQFNKVQQLSDQKAAWLFSQVRELADQGGYAITAGMVDALTKGIATSMQAGTGVVGEDIGAANAYVVDYTPAVSALKDGMALWFKVKTANTGASTLNVNGLGVRSIIGMGHAALQGGEMVANGKALVVWKSDASSWVLVGCSGGALQIAPATSGSHAMRLGQATGRLLRTTIYTRVGGVQHVSVDGGPATTVGAATWTRLPDTSLVDVEVQGSGGAGGGVAATAAGQVAAAYGGQAGSYGRSLFAAAEVGASQVVTVGAAGAGGAPGANPGGNGSTSSFGVLLSAPGGIGGGGGTANAAANSLAPAASPSSTPVGANQLAVRGHGSSSFFVLSTGQALGGGGGASFSGPGAQAVGGGGGVAAANPGAGGSGAAVGPGSGAAYSGGSGATGYLIVREYA